MSVVALSAHHHPTSGQPVKDLYEYSDALYSHKPGEEVKIVVLRKNERVTLTVTLGKRGGD